MNYLKQLDQRITDIEDRNQAVEKDKAWEVSYSRGLILFFTTFILFGLYLMMVQVDKPWLNAIVPSAAFVLAPLTLPPFKKIWLKYFYKATK